MGCLGRYGTSLCLSVAHSVDVMVPHSFKELGTVWASALGALSWGLGRARGSHSWPEGHVWG